MKSELTNLVMVFKALSCETRLKIVIGLMGKKDCNVNLMAEKLGLAQPNVSQHLTVLKNAGIIEGFRKGTQICYKIVDSKIDTLLKSLSKDIQ